MAERNSNARNPRRNRRHHHQRHQHQGNKPDQAASKRYAGVPKSVMIEEPGVEATAAMDGSGLQVGVISTIDHFAVVDALSTACCSELLLKGVESHNLHIAQVALPTELPFVTRQLICAAPEPLDAVIVIGCLVEEDSLPMAAVAHAVANAMMLIGSETMTPVVYGILNCKRMVQARQCAGLTPNGRNFGAEWAQTAITMARQGRCSDKI
ncbi:unnamed protein product [Phytophthora lilii]|uniref:6,7-dimethyl-8-ribityllumazine synthase n=1 Tax=Phytophthora lilii TaxID=2077276 RepID=A0A9W7D8L3_9STRA|nr:unnamed protein product [Phytophthora lilii]